MYMNNGTANCSSGVESNSMTDQNKWVPCPPRVLFQSSLSSAEHDQYIVVVHPILMLSWGTLYSLQVRPKSITLSPSIQEPFKVLTENERPSSILWHPAWGNWSEVKC